MRAAKSGPCRSCISILHLHSTSVLPYLPAGERHHCLEWIKPGLGTDGISFAGGGCTVGKCSVFWMLLVGTAKGQPHLQCASSVLAGLHLHQSGFLWSIWHKVFLQKYLGFAFGFFYVPPGERFPAGAAACAIWGALGNLQVTHAVADAAPRGRVWVPGSSTCQGKLPCCELLLLPNLAPGEMWATFHVEKKAKDLMAQILPFRGINTSAAAGRWNPALQWHKCDVLCPCLGWASCTLCTWGTPMGTPGGHPPCCTLPPTWPPLTLPAAERESQQ